MKKHKNSKLVILYMVSCISLTVGEALSSMKLMNKYVNIILSIVIPLICILLYIYDKCKGNSIKAIIYSVLILLIIPLLLYYIILLFFI